MLCKSASRRIVLGKSAHVRRSKCGSAIDRYAPTNANQQAQLREDGCVQLMTEHLSDTHSAFGLNGMISGREIQKQVREDGHVPLVAVCAVSARGGFWLEW